MLLDGKTFDMTGVWENGENAKFGYDFWYQPGHNVMVSSAWGDPKAWRSGFNPKHVEQGRFSVECVLENGQNAKLGYDFWYQPGHNVMVSSVWGDP